MWGGQSNNLWWEWVGGAVMLAAAVFGIYVFGFSNDD